MARRKLRPLGILAILSVILVFHLLRKSGKEVFTFDTLPPYTDTDYYVKKPTPAPIPWTAPPPPPPDWPRQQHRPAQQVEDWVPGHTRPDTRPPPAAADKNRPPKNKPGQQNK